MLLDNKTLRWKTRDGKCVSVLRASLQSMSSNFAKKSRICNHTKRRAYVRILEPNVKFLQIHGEVVALPIHSPSLPPVRCVFPASWVPRWGRWPSCGNILDEGWHGDFSASGRTSCRRQGACCTSKSFGAEPTGHNFTYKLNSPTVHWCVSPIYLFVFLFLCFLVSELQLLFSHFLHLFLCSSLHPAQSIINDLKGLAVTGSLHQLSQGSLGRIRQRFRSCYSSRLTVGHWSRGDRETSPAHSSVC